MKFSVIIPVFNKAATLSRAIDSIYAQECKDFEIIIVNDGSTDNIKSVIEKYPGVVVVNKKNGGVSSARNAGLDIASGEYICFLDADDLWLNFHLTELLNLIYQYPHNEMFLTSHYVDINGKRRNSSDLYSSSMSEVFESDNLFELLNLYGDGIIHTNSVCIKKTIIDNYKFRFDEDSKLGEDVDMWFRVALRTNVGISKRTTTIYQRDFSTATKNGMFTEKWVFARRNDTIQNDSSILSERKNECLKMIDRNRLYTCRELMLIGNIKEAKAVIKKVNYKSGFNYIVTKILLMLPLSVAKTIIQLR